MWMAFMWHKQSGASLPKSSQIPLEHFWWLRTAYSKSEKKDQIIVKWNSSRFLFLFIFGCCRWALFEFRYLTVTLKYFFYLLLLMMLYVVQYDVAAAAAASTLLPRCAPKCLKYFISHVYKFWTCHSLNQQSKSMLSPKMREKSEKKEVIPIKSGTIATHQPQ